MSLPTLLCDATVTLCHLCAQGSFHITVKIADTDKIAS